MRRSAGLAVLLLFAAPARAEVTRQAGVRVGGRVFVRETFRSIADRPWSSELALASARIELSYRLRRTMRVVVEAEAERGVRDAFLRLRGGDGLAVRAGRFKMPISIIQMESAWVLPVVRRGLLGDVLDEGLEAAGRAPGVQLELEPWTGVGFETRLGAWQGRDAAGDPGPTRLSEGGVTAAVRVDFDTGSGVTLGTAAQLRDLADKQDPIHRDRFWAAEADLMLVRGGARAWAELLVGDSHLSDGVFAATRLILAWRANVGGSYIEPFAMFAAFDVHLEAPSDRAWEVAMGLNFGKWDRYRIQAEAELRDVAKEAPLGLEEGVAVLIQLGAVF